MVNSATTMLANQNGNGNGNRNGGGNGGAATAARMAMGGVGGVDTGVALQRDRRSLYDDNKAALRKVRNTEMMCLCYIILFLLCCCLMPDDEMVCLRVLCCACAYVNLMILFS
jgi:hypothetical protein